MLKLIQTSLWKYALCLTSAFNSPSILKSRIMMLYQKNSHRIALSKFLLAIPVLALCLVVASFIQRQPVVSVLDEQFNFLKKITVKTLSKNDLKYIFVNKNEYLFRFIDTKTQKILSAPEGFILYATKNNEEVKQNCVQKFDGLWYAPESTGFHTLTLNNTSTSDIDVAIYFKEKVAKITKIEGDIHTNPEILPALPVFAQVNQDEYPKEAYSKEIEGDVIYDVIVNLDGTLSDIKLAQGLRYGCDELALKKVQALKSGAAGFHKGKAVRTKMQVRVGFKMFPQYLENAEPVRNILQTIPLSAQETKIVLEKGKKYFFVLSETQSLSKEDLDKIMLQITQASGLPVAQNRMGGKLYLTTIYKAETSGEYKISVGETATLKAGKLVIGTK